MTSYTQTNLTKLWQVTSKMCLLVRPLESFQMGSHFKQLKLTGILNTFIDLVLHFHAAVLNGCLEEALGCSGRQKERKLGVLILSECESQIQAERQEEQQTHYETRLVK